MKVFVAGAWVSVAAVIAVIIASGGGGSLSCTGAAVTTSTFSARVSGASPGDTLCLSSGSYGSWGGTNKAITIAADSSQSPTFSAVSFTSNTVCCFTMDGSQGTMTIGTGTAGVNMDMKGQCCTYAFNSSEPHLIAFNYVHFRDTINVDYIVESKPTHTWAYTLKFFHTTHDNIDLTGTSDTPSRINFPYGNDETTAANNFDSGVVVDNVEMSGGCADGIQSGAGLTITNSEFGPNIAEHSGSPTFCNPSASPGAHSDAIQIDSMGLQSHTIITGNYIHDNSDAIVSYDGFGNIDVADNVLSSNQPTEHCVDLAGDNSGPGTDPSTFKHNTGFGSCTLEFEQSHAGVDSIGTIVSDNIWTGGYSFNEGVTASEEVFSNNMIPSGATGTDFNGTPTYSGGATPSSYTGFCLTAGSAGHLAGSDGLDVGIRC
jgi:hypothetical protein